MDFDSELPALNKGLTHWQTLVRHNHVTSDPINWVPAWSAPPYPILRWRTTACWPNQCLEGCIFWYANLIVSLRSCGRWWYFISFCLEKGDTGDGPFYRVLGFVLKKCHPKIKSGYYCDNLFKSLFCYPVPSPLLNESISQINDRLYVSWLLSDW